MLSLTQTTTHMFESKGKHKQKSKDKLQLFCSIFLHSFVLILPFKELLFSKDYVVNNYSVDNLLIVHILYKYKAEPISWSLPK